MNVKELVSQNRTKLIIILSTLIVLTLCFIWEHSLMPVKNSLNESNYFFDMIKPVLDSIIGPNGFNDYTLRNCSF